MKTMEKRYFWAIMATDDGVFLNRYRSEQERTDFLIGSRKTPGILSAYPVIGNYSEVRRIQRRIRQGEVVTFPVEV